MRNKYCCGVQQDYETCTWHVTVTCRVTPTSSGVTAQQFIKQWHMKMQTRAVHVVCSHWPLLLGVLPIEHHRTTGTAAAAVCSQIQTSI